MTQDTNAQIAALEEVVQELATAVESVVAALLIRDRDPQTSLQLLKDAGALAASIRGATDDMPAKAQDKHDA